MSTAIAPRIQTSLDPKILEQVLLGGDLSKLTTEQRLSYYLHLCEMLGLNPHTRPFDYITLNGKLVLYAKKDATDQLRKIHEISIKPEGFSRELIEGIYIVTASASMPSGRTDVSTGAVPIDGWKGEARANQMMKAETKAKRRVTLSICGLGMLDETEVETIVPLPINVIPKERIQLPPDTVQILSVVPYRMERGGELAEVTYVDDKGEQHTHRTSVDAKGASVDLFTQLSEEKVPVVLKTKVTPKKGGTVIESATRWQPPPPTPEPPKPEAQPDNAKIDAEIAAKDANLAF